MCGIDDGPITGHLGDRIIAQEELEIADGKIEFFPDRSVLVPEIGLFGCEISLRVQIEKKAIILEIPGLAKAW